MEKLFTQEELDSIRFSDENIFWVDVLGHELEAKGVDPGCIFEFTSALREDAMPGGIIVFTKSEHHKLENIADYMGIRHTFVRLASNGELMQLSGGNPLVTNRLLSGLKFELN